MMNIDMLVIEIVNGEIKVTDLWSNSNSKPEVDASQDFTLLTSIKGEKIVNVTFSRKLNTGDSA